MGSQYDQFVDLLQQPGTVAMLLPLLIVSTCLLVAFGFGAAKLMMMLFGGSDETSRPRLLLKLIALLTRRQAKTRTASDPSLGGRTKRLEKENAELRTQIDTYIAKVTDLHKEVEILQAALHTERGEAAHQHEKLLAVQRHSEKLEAQMEQVVVEFERIYRHAPLQEGPFPETPLQAPADPSAATSSPAKDSGGNDVEKLKAILRAYKENVDHQKKP